MTEILAFQAVLVICATTAFVASLQFIRRLVEMRQQRSPRAPLDGLDERLYRIETTVESTALEVERLSEANRFIAKLLAERSGSAGASSRPERVITPH